MRKIFSNLIITIFIALCFAQVYAADFTVEVESLTKHAITVDENAEFKLVVTNNIQDNQTIVITPKDPSWIVDTVPKSDYLFTLGPDESKEISLNVKPKLTADLEINKNYFIEVSIKSKDTDEDNIQRLGVILQDSQTRRNFMLGKCVRMNPVFPMGVVDPREPIVISSNFSGTTCDNLDDTVIIINSDLFVEQTTPDHEVIFNIDPKTEPGMYPVTMQVKMGDFIVREPRFSVQILEYENIVETKKVKSLLFGVIKTKTIELANEGNSDVDSYTYELKKGFFDMFRSYEPSVDVVEKEEGNFHIWELEFERGETKEIIVKSNYTLLLVIIFAIILIGVYVVLTRDRLELTKKVTNLGSNEDGLSKFKIMVHVKNKTNIHLKNIKVNDKIPHIATLEKSEYVGTIKPTKILRHAKKGTMLIWDLEELNPKEERILYYEIKSKLNIIGNFNLPSSVAKVKDIFNRNVKILSNRATVSEKKTKK